MAFSLAAIILVLIMLRITTLAYNKNNKTWLDTFQYVWASADKVNEVLRSPEPESTYGNLGSFEGYEQSDDKRKWVYLSDAENQPNLVEILNVSSPNRVGTSLQRL